MINLTKESSYKGHGLQSNIADMPEVISKGSKENLEMNDLADIPKKEEIISDLRKSVKAEYEINIGATKSLGL